MAADRPVVICPPLCFLFSKLNKLSNNKIIDILCEYYEPDAILRAKKLLGEAVKELNADNTLPQLRARRDTDVRSRARKDAADIEILVSALDRRGLLDQLPIFVIDNTDSVPTVKLEEGDMRYFVLKINRMEEAILTLQGTINKLYAFATGAMPLPDATGTTGETQFSSHRHSHATPVNDNSLYHSRLNSVPDFNEHTVTVDVQSEPRSTVYNSASRVTGPLHSRAQTQTEHTNTSSSSAVATAVANEHYRRNWADVRGSASSAIETDNTTAGTDDDDFTVVESRRQKRRRRNATSDVDPSPDQRQSTVKSLAAVVAAAAAATDNKTTRPAKKPLVVGTLRSPAARDIGNLSAAKPLYGKAVYYVSNVNKVVTEDDLKHFVKSTLGVRVITCNKTKPRLSFRERRDGIAPDHNAFCLCINKADAKLLLRPDKWPSDVSISAWYFKPKTDGSSAAAAAATANDRQREQQQTGTATDDAVVERQTTPPSAAAVAAAPPSAAAAGDVDNIVRDTANNAAAETTDGTEPMSQSPVNSAADNPDELHSAGNSSADTIVETLSAN